MDISDEDDKTERETSHTLTFRDYEDAEDWQDKLLHIAAQFGDIAAMERLVAEGMDINGRTDILHEWFANDDTPLMVAAMSEHGATAETVKWLLEHGADPHLTSGSGVTAAWYAAGGYPSPSSLLGRNLDRSERLRLLLDAGLSPYESIPNGESLLTGACGSGNPISVRLLLDRGVSPHPVGGPPDNPDAIPLTCAARSGSVECVRLLLDAGANVHERTVSNDEYPGHTIIEYATSAEIVRILVAAGADVNAQSGIWDVLDEALDNANRDFRYFETIEALVEAGASLHARTLQGTSRLHYAAYLQQTIIVQWLLSKGVVPDGSKAGNTPLHSVCRSEMDYTPPNARCERIIRALVAAGVPVDVPGELGRAPMHHAVVIEKGNPVAIRTLLKLGAQPDPVDEKGHSPLHIAAFWCNSVECIQLLLDAGADPNRPDHEGCKPLDHYASREKKGLGNPEVYSVLAAAVQATSPTPTASAGDENTPP